jgi:hypothetical protein
MSITHVSDSGYADQAAALAGAYAGGGAAVLRGEAVYALPPGAVDTLSKEALGGTRRAPLFTPAQAEAERGFAEFCGSLRCVGVRAGRPVEYPLLTPRPPVLTPGLLHALKWTGPTP